MPDGAVGGKLKPRVLVLHSNLWSRLQFHWDVPRCGLVVLSGTVRLVSTWGRCLGCGTSAPPTQLVSQCCLRAAHVSFRPEGPCRPLSVVCVVQATARPTSLLICSPSRK